MSDAMWLLLGVAGLCLVAAAASVLISRLTAFGPAGPIALLVAAPAVPTIPIGFHISTDDILPAVGLGLLLLRQPWPMLTRGTLPRVALIAMAVITLTRIASTLANESGLTDVASGLVGAIGRPLFMVAAVAFVASTLPAERRRQLVGQAVALMGTAEAIASLAAFTVGLPGGFGVQPIRRFEDLGGCDGRIIGTLGLSPNHIGAVFVLTLPMTLAMAARSTGWRRWAWALGAVLQAVALYYTFTRASIILGGLAALAFLVIMRRYRLLLVAALATFVGVSLLSAGFCRSTQPGQLPGGGGVVNPPVVDVGRFSDPTDRAALWYAAIRITVDHPVFGVGIGRMLETVNANAAYANTPYGVATSSAHNTILLASAETGVIGGLATALLNLILALLALSWLVRSGQDVALARAASLAVLAFLVQGMFNNLLTVPATSVPFAMLIAAFLSIGQEPLIVRAFGRQIYPRATAGGDAPSG